MTLSGKLPPDYRVAVDMSLIPGHTKGSRVGSNDTIPNSTFILLSNITSAASPINFPAAAQQMQVVSSSANDAAGNPGAQQVTIEYLTSPTNSLEPFKLKSEIVNMNGLGAVLTNATDIFRIDRFRVSRVGTGLFAAGNISLQSAGGATTFERIDTGTNVNRTCIHFVQKGYGSILSDIQMGASTAGGVIFIVERTELDPSGNPVTLGRTQIELASNAFGMNYQKPHGLINDVGQIMFYAIVVRGRASNQAASASIHFIDFPL